MFSQLKERARLSAETIASIQKFFTDDNLKLKTSKEKKKSDYFLYGKCIY